MENNAQFLVPHEEQQTNKIPIIDFTKPNLNPGTSSWVSTCKAVREAMEEFGCFIAVSDIVGSEHINEVFASLKELFNLPKEKKFLNISDQPGLGYFGPNPQVPLHESMGIGDSTTKEAVQSFTNLMWPSGNDHFCETIHSYTKQVSELNNMVARMIFESHGVGKYCDSHIESTSYLLRVNAYREPQNNETNVGILPHTDSSFLTLLKQDEVHGLQVQSKDDAWIAVDFPPSSFVVMGGDALLAWSNGRIRPCLHRVMMTKKARFSIGLFCFHNGIVQIPKELAADDIYPLRFHSFDHFGLLNFRSKNPTLSSEERVKAYCGV